MSATPHIASIETALAWLWQTSWQTALLAVAIGVITWTLRRWISPQARQMLWLLVFLRLVMPALPGSRFSIFGLYSSPKTETITYPVHSVSTIDDVPFFKVESSPALKTVIVQPSIWSNPQIWLLMVWISGAAILFGHAIASTLRFSRIIRRDGQQPDSSTSAIIEECCRHAQASSPDVILTDHVATPALFGVLRPTLLLPRTLMATLNRQCLRSVILHELQHLKRKHLAMDWLLTLIRAVHWFNPAAWLAHRQVRAARELICDQAVIASLADENAPRNYGLTLLTIAGGALRKGEPSLVAAFAREHKLLRERIETIAGFRKRRYIAGLGLLLALILTVMFLTNPSSDLHAQDNQPTSKRAATTSPIPNEPLTNGYEPKAIMEDRRQAQNQTVYEKLEKKLPEVRLDNVDLQDAVEFLQDVSGIKIVADWTELEKAGINRKTPVSAPRTRDIQFSKILSIILTAGGGKVKLDYKVVDEGITIFVADDATTKPQSAVTDQNVQVMVKSMLLEVPTKLAAEADNQPVLDDVTVNQLISRPGVKVMSRPYLLAKNDQEAALNITGDEGTSFALTLQSNVSSDRKYINVKASMLYSPNPTVSAQLQGQLGPLLSAYTAAKLATIEARANFGAGSREISIAQQREESYYNEWQQRVNQAYKQLASGDKLGEKWELVEPIATVPDGGSLLLRKIKHYTYQIQPDGTFQPMEAPPGDTTFWLLLRPTIVLKRDNEPQQFPLLDK